MPTSPRDTASALTPQQMAARLNCSVWTIYRAIERGQLHAFTIGTGKSAPLRVWPEEFARFIKRHERRIQKHPQHLSRARRVVASY